MLILFYPVRPGTWVQKSNCLETLKRNKSAQHVGVEDNLHFTPTSLRVLWLQQIRCVYTFASSEETAMYDNLLSPDLQRWQRSCPTLSRGTSRTRGGDHTWWWRRRRPGRTFIIGTANKHAGPLGPSPLTHPATLFLSAEAAFMCRRRREGVISTERRTGELADRRWRSKIFFFFKEYTISVCISQSKCIQTTILKVTKVISAA